MTSRLNPYLAFNGKAREAVNFYQSVFGGELTVSTFGDFGSPDPALATKVMHAQLVTPQGYTLMASDIAPGMPVPDSSGTGITCSLSGDTSDGLHDIWAKLSAEGTVTMPLEKQAWGDEFGQCIDKFGTPWLVNITQPTQ